MLTGHTKYKGTVKRIKKKLPGKGSLKTISFQPSHPLFVSGGPLPQNQPQTGKLSGICQSTEVGIEPTLSDNELAKLDAITTSAT